jgi:hypothetical protein
MMDLAPVPPPTERHEADRALNQLRAALDVRGITLPSLDLDAVTLATIHNGSTDLRPLIDLGRVNLETARKLARALNGAGAQ